MHGEKILIVGAGPAGAATSLFLSKKKIPHVIIDKAVFPRDKICGDALSGKVVHILNKLNPDFADELSADENKFTGSYGISFFAPNGRKLDVPFSLHGNMLKNAPGFIAKRINFDEFLVNKLNRNYADVRLQTELTDVIKNIDGIVATLRNASGEKPENFRLIVGAEGDRSVVAKKLDPVKKDLSNYCAALRVYYSGVKDTHENKFIELHFLKDILPGYFWIFPMNDGTANVGIGMLSDVVAKKKINLKNKLEEIITEHPAFKKRFEGAKAIDEIRGWGLPLGSQKRNLAGDNFLLCGDAGSLIDPFTGEGIGNALLSGMMAADTIELAIKENRFDAAFLSTYEKRLYNNLGKELDLSRGIQKLAQYSWLFNFVVRKANKNSILRETMTCMFDDVDMRARLRKPSFYFKLLFN